MFQQVVEEADAEIEKALTRMWRATDGVALFAEAEFRQAVHLIEAGRACLTKALYYQRQEIVRINGG